MRKQDRRVDRSSLNQKQEILRNIRLAISINQFRMIENYNEQFLKYLNLARQTPKRFIPLLQQQLSTFLNDKQIPLDKQIVYETIEGKSAWIEAKHFLLKQIPLPPLLKHEGLCKSAHTHQRDLCLNGNFDHEGSDGSTFCDRISRFCKKGPGGMAEMIGLDFNIKGRRSTQLTILGLIIDDGISERSHRKTIFDPSYRYVGWSTGIQDEKMVTVFNLLENNFDLLPDPIEEQAEEEENTTVKPEKNQSENDRNSLQCSGGQKNPFRDITNQATKHQQFLKSRSSVMKKLYQKHEQTRIFFESGSKIIEKTTKLIYKDGTVEEIAQRKTIYDDD